MIYENSTHSVHLDFGPWWAGRADCIDENDQDGEPDCFYIYEKREGEEDLKVAMMPVSMSNGGSAQEVLSDFMDLMDYVASVCE